MNQERPEAEEQQETPSEPDEASPPSEEAPHARRISLNLAEFLTSERLRLIGVVVGLAGLGLVIFALWKLLFSQPELPSEFGPSAEAAAGADSSQPETVSPPAAAEQEVSPQESIPSSEAMVPTPPPVPEESAPPEMAVAPPEPKPAPAEATTPRPERPSVRVVRSSRRRAPNEELVRLEPVEPLEKPLSAYEQLMLSRRLGGRTSSSTPAGTAGERDSPVPERLLPVEDQALEIAFSSADPEFIQLMVEEIAQIPQRLPRGQWDRLRESPSYRRALTGIYDYILTTQDKLLLLGAYAREYQLPSTTPAYLRSLQLPKRDLQSVRDAIWAAHQQEIVSFLAGLP